MFYYLSSTDCECRSYISITASVAVENSSMFGFTLILLFGVYGVCPAREADVSFVLGGESMDTYESIQHLHC